MAAERVDKSITETSNDWGVLSLLSESALEALKLIRQAAEKASSDRKARAILPDVPVGSDSAKDSNKSNYDHTTKFESIIPMFVTTLLNPKEASPIPAEGCKARPGEKIAQADGGTILFDLAADGKVRPKAITFSNGVTCTYAYDKEGRLISVTALDKEGKNELYKIEKTDGKPFTLTANDTTENEIGELSVRSDGTWKLVGRQRNWVPCFDGSPTSIEGTDFDSHVRIYRPNGTIILRFEGQRCVWFKAKLGKDTQVDFTENQGDLTLCVSEKGVSPIVYRSKNDGTTWLKCRDSDGSGQAVPGSLTLNNDFLPYFKDSGDKQKDVDERGIEQTATDKQRSTIRAIQYALDARLEEVYETERRVAVEKIKEEYRKKIVEKGGWDKLSPEEQKRHAKALFEAIQRRSVELEEVRNVDRNTLKQEIDQLRLEVNKRSDKSNPEDLWQSFATTRRLYGMLINWLQDTAVPEMLSHICSQGSNDIPANNPHQVPRHEGTKFFLNHDYYRTLAASGYFGGSVKLGLDWQVLPTEQSLEKLGRTIGWLEQARKDEIRARLDHENKILLPSIITNEGMPRSWVKEFDENPEGKRAALKEMLDVGYKMRNYTQAMSAMKMDEVTGKGPVFFIGSSEEPIPAPPFCTRFMENGRAIYRLQWPGKLELESPETAEKLESWKAWLDKHGQKIDAAIAKWVEQNENHLKRLFYGEIEGEAYVTFDKDNRLNKILEPLAPGDSKEVREAKEKEREGATRCNLLSCDFEVEERNGKIFVKTKVQAKNAHQINYLNIGADKVKHHYEEDFGAKGKDGKPIGLSPDEPVAIRDGSGQVHIVPARDLRTWHQYQRFTYWGSKTTTAVMDVGMTVAGLASGGSAAVAWRAGTILTGPALRTVGLATFRGTLGASGFVLNNAHAHTDPALLTLHDLRGKAMLLDITLGTASIVGFGRSAQATARAQAFARGIDEAFEVSSPSILAAVAEPLHAVTHGEKYSTAYRWAMNGANYYFLPVVSTDIYEQIHQINKHGQPDPYAVGLQYTRGGRDLEGPPKSPERIIAEHRKTANLDLFDSYVATILQRKEFDQETTGKLKEIASKVHELLKLQMPNELAAKDVPDSHRELWLERQLESYKAELLAHIYGPAEQVAGRIANANKGKKVDEAVTHGEARTLTAPGFKADRKVQLVAMAALLVLSLDEQGNLPANKPLARRQLNLPDHKMYEYKVYTTPAPTYGSGTTYRVDIPGPANASQTIRASDIVERMKENLSADSPAVKMVSGDVLVKLGARSQICQAAILRGVLNDLRASEDDKASAICQLGQIANGMRAVEAKLQDLPPDQRQKFLAHSYGNTSADLYKELQACAGNPHASVRLRTLAAGMLLALQTTAAPDEFGRLMYQQVRQYHEKTSSDPQTNKSIIELKAGLKSDDLGVRMRSALALRDLKELGPFGERRPTGSEGKSAKVRSEQEEDLEGKTKFNLVMISIAKLSIGNTAFQSEGVKAIAALDAASLNRLPQSSREKLRGILDEPTNRDNESLKIALAKRAHEIAITKEDRADFGRALADQINTRRNALYAERFPLLRIAAIEALAELGETIAIPLIAQRLKPPTDGEQPHSYYEPDARVRLAALNALVDKKIDAPDLDGIISAVYFRETDAAVRARLSQVRNQTERPVRDWHYYEDRDKYAAGASESQNYSKEEALARLENLKEPLNCSGPEKLWDQKKGCFIWRDKGILVPDENKDGLVWERRMTVSAGATMGGGLSEGWVPRKALVTNPKYGEFWRAFDEQILKPAFNVGDREARMALVFLVLHGGKPVGTEGDPARIIAVNKAVDRIVDLLHDGSGVSGELFDGVKRILGNYEQVDDSVRLKLLNALQCYAKGELPFGVRDRLGKFPPGWREPSTQYKQRVGEIAIAALEADLTTKLKKADQGDAVLGPRQELRAKMLEIIGESRPRRAYLILDAIALIADPAWVAINRDFQNKAKETLADIRDSVRLIWTTSPDRNGDPRQRANELSESLLGKRERNSYDMAKAVIQAAKGEPIHNGDPRIELLKLALNCNRENDKQKPSTVDPKVADAINSFIGRVMDAIPGAEKNVRLANLDQNGSEQVRLAAAMVVLQSENDGFNKETRNKAVEIVAKLAFEGVEYGYRRDALAILQKCDKESIVSAIRKQISDLSGKTERAQLELAKYVLSGQKDFTEQDKQAAFRIVCSLAFAGDDQGHCNEALKILKASVSAENNHAAVAALGDFVRANPHCADKKYERLDEKNSLSDILAVHAESHLSYILTLGDGKPLPSTATGTDAEILRLEKALKDTDDNVRLMSASLILVKENTERRYSLLDELAIKTLYDLALSSSSATVRRLATELLDTVPPQLYSAERITSGKRPPEKRITVLAELFKSYMVEDKKDELKIVACAESLEALHKEQGSQNSRECLAVKLERLKHELGDKHSEVLSLYEQLGDLCRKEKDFSEAQRYCKLAIEGYDKGDNGSVAYARARVNLAQVYYERMASSDALKECFRATTKIVDTLGDAHPESVRARLLLAHIQSRLAEHADKKYMAELENGGKYVNRLDASSAAINAHAAYVNALASTEKCYGKDSLQAIELLLTIARFYFSYPDGQEFYLDSQKKTATELGMIAANKLLAYADRLMTTGDDGAKHAAEIAEKVSDLAYELERIGDKKIRPNPQSKRYLEDRLQLDRITVLSDELQEKSRKIRRSAIEKSYLPR